MGRRRKSTKSTTTSQSQLALSQMIIEAISTLKDISGSTQPAIADFIQDNNYGGKALPPPNFRKLVSLELKKLVDSQKLSKNRNSYQLPSDAVAVSQKKKISSRSKRLSQVKTPEGFKLKKQKVVVEVEEEEEEEEVESAEVIGNGKKKKKVGQQKVKRLSEVKTPEVLKKKMKKKPSK